MSAGVVAAHYAAGGGSSVATVTVPAGKVASTLTGFVTRVDLATLPAGWWATVAADGSDIRVRQAGSDLPFDLVLFDKSAKTGDLFFKATLSTSANVFTIEQVSGATAPAATDPIGRNAVWADYDFVAARGNLTNRTGGASATHVGFALNREAAAVGPNIAAAHPQGIAKDAAGNFYITFTDEIRKYDSSWTLVTTRTGANAATGIAGVNHLGGAHVYNGELYVANETYTNSPYNNQHVTVWNLSTLAFVRSYNISAGGHEASGLTRNPANGHWFVTDFTTNTVIHEYDETFTYVAARTLSSAVNNMQDVAFADGYLWIASGASTSAGFIYRTNLDGTGVAGAWRRGIYTTAASVEGICGDDAGVLYLLDEAMGGTIRFSPTTTTFGTGGFGYLKVVGVPKRTSWTIGVSYAPSAKRNVNSGIASYSDNTGNNANRASMSLRSASPYRLALWNSTNSWLDDPGAEVGYFQRIRAHHTQSGGTSRAIYRNGALKASGAAAQRPASTGDTLFFGAEDTDNSEYAPGNYDYLYLRNGVLSADWIAAEYASWESPATFYTAA